MTTMPIPYDPGRTLGSLWCLTVTGLPLPEALAAMGVTGYGDLLDGLEQASEREAGALAAVERTALVLAKPLAPDVVLLLELESGLGWRGTDPEVLGDLAPPGASTACSVVQDPNRTQVLFAEDGGVAAQYDAVAGLLLGRPTRALAAGLAAAGLPIDGYGEADLSPGVQAARALEAATGVGLTPEMCANPWTGGLYMD